MEVQSRRFFTRVEIRRAIGFDLIEFLIESVVRHINMETKEYSIGIIRRVLKGPTMTFPDGTKSNIYLDCEEPSSTEEKKIVRVPMIALSNKEPLLTDIGFEFIRIIRMSYEWMEMMFINRMVMSWMKDIEREWLFENFIGVDERPVIDPGSPCSSYSDD